ncbi:MAG: hypothetical protein K0R12_227 [Gammaproteobacteria bacterium]|jgi:hydroxymethylglutaryl-CoA reductase|nr:hypothetical protein [Gammaproteobacteria bacterium]
MTLSTRSKTLFDGFSKLNRRERLSRLVEMGALSPDDVTFLNMSSGLNPDLAENFIENVMGYFQLPLGVAAHFHIDGRNYAIPMAVEETSIIAAVSKMAKWVRKHGTITTEIKGSGTIGQLQLSRVASPLQFEQTLLRNKDFLIHSANQDIAAGLVRRGGGVRDIEVRKIKRPDLETMIVCHVHVETCDAMGANIVTQVCEFLKTPIYDLTGEMADIAIISNLPDCKLTQATICIPAVDPVLAEGLVEASLFAECDPYRAATHNKGVLNGIDPVLIATGNDWRAVEAAVHAYAARSGQYRPITRWVMEGKSLVGTFEAPLPVGIVGGVTRLHPTAKMCLKMLNIKHADELSRIAAAVGLVQNLGALTALSTVGLTEGHMRLHISNLTIEAGAKGAEIPLVKKQLEEILSLRKRISASHAIEVLKELRERTRTSAPAAALVNHHNTRE